MLHPDRSALAISPEEEEEIEVPERSLKFSKEVVFYTRE
ncbi:uncharacterized protein J3R85_013870 [Psidium guajava]|nr:uncharacterized protein J3R85_013870 [Psidium guajava]